VESWDRVFIHLLSENREKGMDLFKCSEMPPVIRPREGLTVALWRGKTSGGWCRAEIVRCEDMVRVVDWGIRNVRLFRQLPDQCLGVPVQAVPLHLHLVAL